MTEEQKGLSSDARTVLELISQGLGYEQILRKEPSITYPKIFNAAREALMVIDAISCSPAYNVADIRQDFPRAYQQWTQEEDERLRYLISVGKNLEQIAELLHRQAGAIRSRKVKLGLG